MKLKIATRKSRLAQVQTEIVMNLLKKKYGVESEKILIETYGDKRLDITLDKIGGKGLFVKEIEKALLDNEADASVHSMKDVPFDVMKKFEIAAICEREDARDVFVSRNNVHFKDLKQGAVIGTSSNRRAAQIKNMRNDLNIVPVRGNVQTRIKKMTSEKMDGIILASAGLKRLNMENVITEYFSMEDMVPAIGQGALGIEIMSGSRYGNLFKTLDNKNTRLCVEAERSFMRYLKGDCRSIIGAYASISENTMYVTGIFHVRGRLIKDNISGNVEDYKELGKTLADGILRKGAM